MSNASPQIPSSSGQPEAVQVGSEHAGQRLDRFLVQHLGDVSRTTIQQMIASGAIHVNGRASKPGYVLRAGETILISRATRHEPISAYETSSMPMPLDIVYEDADLLVVNKPAGLVVHPAPGHADDTLVNALLAYLPALRGAGNGEKTRPGIVHRLDKDTSGLLIVAKTPRAHAALVEQMKRHEVIKRYIALVEGNVSLDQGSIDAPIGRDPRHRQQMAITVVGSREARTHFRVLRRFARHTLLELQLETGRTHQIRLHLKAIGHPVVGDSVYGSGNALKRVPLKRQFLHASQLHFHHPVTGQLLELEAPLPDDLQNVLNLQDFL
jgi:23S rRNA pseudouridine1911/1915/1917 synthase